MENEIKVKEYIRTDDGRIYKLEYLEDEVFLSDKFYNNIGKHSPNLIDIIEERRLCKWKRSKTYSGF